MTPSAHIPSRSDGAQARQKLLTAALRLFADKGYRDTSTREIAEAAGVNLSAISYYFGDKSSLYQAAMHEPLCDKSMELDPASCLPDPAGSGLSCAESLQAFFSNFLQPLQLGETVRLVMRLHFRELVEPSGALPHPPGEEMRPLFQRLLALLCGQLGLASPDADAHRLALCMLGLPLHFFVAQEMVANLAPGITDTPADIDTLARRMTDYALGMLDAEASRRTRQREAG